MYPIVTLEIINTRPGFCKTFGNHSKKTVHRILITGMKSVKFATTQTKNDLKVYCKKMNTLQDIASEIVRKNWLNHKDEIYNSPYYEILWDRLQCKCKIDKNDRYFPIFKKFINNETQSFDSIQINQINNETLVLKGLDGKERKHIHLLCDKIGLHHESKSQPKKKYNRFIYIYKPKIWTWEYTEKNPYSNSKEYY